jgi:epoxide hydrolase
LIDIQPFRIAVADEDIADLRARLRGTRWAETWPDPEWSYGVDPNFLRDLCRYWAEEYNWRHHESELNRFAQYRTRVDGAQLHFLHVRSPEPDALPLVMTHGWPGSIVEFIKVLGLTLGPTRT